MRKRKVVGNQSQKRRNEEDWNRFLGFDDLGLSL